MRLGLGLRLSGTGGAAEADTTAPEITNLSAGTQTDGDLPVSFDLSENATIFWVLDSSTPSPEETRDGQASGGGSPSDSGSFSATAGDGVTREFTFTSGLSGSYNLTFVGRDAAGNLASTVDTVAVTIDSTAPTLSSATGTQTGQTTADWGVTSNEAGGTIYAGVRPTAAAALTDTQLIAGSGGAGVAWDNDATPTADSANGGAFTGLTAATAYKVDTVQVDAQGNTSSVVSSAEFTTAAAGFTDPTSLGSKLIAWLDFTDTSTLWQDTARTTAATSVSDPVRYVDDKSGNGNDFSATAVNSAGNMLVISGGVDVNDAGFKIDGTATGFTSGMECYALIDLNGDTYTTLLGDDGNASFGSGISQDGSGLAVDGGTTGTITHTVDGVDQSSPTRETLHDAIVAAGPGYVIQGLRGIDLSGLTTGLMAMAYSSAAIRLSGNAKHFILTTALTTSERADLDTWLDGEK